MKKDKRLEALEAEAGKLTNFSGSGGSGIDPLLSFDGANALATQYGKSGKVIQFSVTNTGGTDEEFYLCPSSQVATDANGHPQSDASIGGNALTYSLKPTTLALFYAFILENPMVMLGFRMNTTDASNISAGVIETTRFHPFIKNGTSKELYLNSYQAETNEQDKIVTVHEPLVFDGQNQIKGSVKAGTTNTYTFFVGPVFSPGDALLKHVNKRMGEGYNPRLQF